GGCEAQGGRSPAGQDRSPAAVWGFCRAAARGRWADPRLCSFRPTDCAPQGRGEGRTRSSGGDREDRSGGEEDRVAIGAGGTRGAGGDREGGPPQGGPPQGGAAQEGSSAQGGPGGRGQNRPDRALRCVPGVSRWNGAGAGKR